MVKLMVIADDFTGALDTGIQFVKSGIQTQIFAGKPKSLQAIETETEVIVVDSETRPMTAKKAYETVLGIVKWGKELGARVIFKKTDSALRGNIGSELQAAIDGSENGALCFIPGYPEIDRLTVEGVHYISGELLEDSVFGKDPFEPVTESYIPDIIDKQSAVNVRCLKINDNLSKESMACPEIIVCDVEKRADIKKRLDELVEMKQLRLIAGCAAVAESLVDKIDFTRRPLQTYRQTEGFLIACGSLNQITGKQLDYAKAHGFTRKHLTMEQKLNPDYYQRDEGKAFLKEILKLCQKNKKVIIDSLDGKESMSKYIKCHGIDSSKVRGLIPYAHGKIADYLAKNQADVTVLMTGGDTLMGYMRLIGCVQIRPICEIEQGVVVSVLENNGYMQQVISKSGGFGEEDVFVKIAEKISVE